MDRDKLAAQLRPEEGIRAFPYDDVTGKPPALKGKLTIGVGRNLTDKPLSQGAIEYLLAEDISEVIQSLDHFLPWWSGHDDVRQRVLADLCFNLGITRLLKFTTFLPLFQAGKYAEAADDLSQQAWHRQVGLRALKLEQMLRTGQDPTS